MTGTPSRIPSCAALFGAFTLSFASAGCSSDSSNPIGGGGSGGAGTGGSSNADCAASVGPIDPTAVIDDIEDNNSLLAQTGNRNGSWWVVSDGTAGTISPPADAAPPPERVPGGHCGSNFAMRVTGQGFTDWGALLSAGFRYTNQAESIDASAFKGIMFWARTGDTNSSSIRVQLQDANTRPEGGKCNATPGTPDECYNGFGTDLIPLGTDWRLYKLNFASMTQRDFGYRADALDPSTLYAIEWTFQASSIFDLWVDDVWFYD
jgi:hypothetical protein